MTSSTIAAGVMPQGHTASPADGAAGTAQNRSFTRLLETVVAGGYCVGCGACAALPASPLRMSLTEHGTYVPVLAQSPAGMDEAAPVAEVCPFFDTGLDEHSLVPAELAASATHDPDVGYYRGVYAGHDVAGPFREQGSSGGLTNWLAAELLETGLVDGIVHVVHASAPSPGGKLFEYGVSRTREELSGGAKSRYYPIEMSAAVRLIREQPGRYAFVGVPCFVKAIRLLQRTDPVIAERVRYCLALFCGHLKSQSFAEHAAWQLGIRPDELVDFDFRTKALDRPASRYSVTAVGLRAGEMVTASAPTAELNGSDWGHGYFKLKACDYCDDIVGETADVSFGDAWLPEFVSDGRGTNIVVTRNRELDVAIQAAATTARIALQPLPVGDVRRSQESNFRHRRDDLAYRLWLADQEGRWRPVKRIAPSDEELPPLRKLVVQRRMHLREASHRAFRLAKSTGRPWLCADLMAGPVDEYEQTLTAERSAAVSKAATPAVQRWSPGHHVRQLARYYQLRALSLWLKASRQRHAGPRSALILPSAAPGSVGDDAMVGALVGALRARGFDRIDLVNLDPNCPRQFSARVDGQLDLSSYFQAWGQPNEITHLLRATRNYRHLFVIGADVLDGYYDEPVSALRLWLAHWAQQAGMRVTVTGFSYNTTPKASAVSALRSLPPDVRLCVRDPVSVGRVERFAGRAPIPVADVALLLEPARPQDADLVFWLARARDAGHRVIGINAIFTSKFFDERSEGAQDRYLQFHLDLIAALARERPDCRFVLIPHDYRPNGVGEGPLLEQMQLLLDDGVRERTFRLTREYSAAEIKWIAGELDFIVSSRMHLAIAAIGQCTPVFCFGYQGKFEGLFELLGQPELLASMEDALADPPAMIHRILGLIDAGQGIRSRLQERLPELLELARNNLPPTE